MIRKEIKNYDYVSELTVGELKKAYEAIGTAVECNDGKAKTLVWEIYY